MLHETLRKVLDTRSGVILPNSPQKGNCYETVFDAEWKGNVHFVVVMSEFRRNPGHYHVIRDGQPISPTYTFTKTDESLFRKMQRLIDDIENGKFSSKKTLSERITSFVEQNGAVSCMNNTKWRELLGALNENMKNIEIQYKNIFDEKAPDEYWELYGDEDIEHMNPAQIQWLKIKHTITEYRHRGALLPPETESYDKKEELMQIFRKYNIPYEYDESENAFVVFGYK
ncbi:MAG: hypothetical protein IKW96_11095 [Ruminococcus sp.]|uniref:DUF6678 family protein n=1 Tax=Ruminococcus sp. TaxID=41978 RepID=UPI0025CD8F08|nr:DUF6678 family protein [Ruminococcus sp.]MBR5683796.1 hypothetical protein [Ruminococcus sp.]